MGEDKLGKLFQRMKASGNNDSDNDSSNNSSNSDNNNSGGTNGSGSSSGGGRGAKFNTDDGMVDPQKDLCIGSAEYMEYVQAVEADKVCSTVDDVSTKSVVFNKNRDVRGIDAECKRNDITDRSTKKDMVAARRSACLIKKLERANFEANQSVETAHRNFLRYRSKASLCNFDTHFDKETRDYGVNKDQFLRIHDRDGNGRINRHDVYLEKHDVNRDGRVDEKDSFSGFQFER